MCHNQTSVRHRRPVFIRRSRDLCQTRRSLWIVSPLHDLLIAPNHVDFGRLVEMLELQSTMKARPGKDKNAVTSTASSVNLTEQPSRPGTVSGEFVTGTLEYDGGRQVTVYVPPRPPEAIVFAGDGQQIAKWGCLRDDAAVPSTMIVGVSRPTDETLRLHEYSPVFDPVRFAAHEMFFVEDVRRWTESRFGVALPMERTAVMGVSAGGELALALGLRHPRVYGAIFCASPGAGPRPPAVMPGLLHGRTLSPASRSRVLSGKRNEVGGGAPQCRSGCRHA